MEGARLIHAEDYQLKEPRVVADALAAYKEEQDWFKHFLEECCEVEPSQKCRSGELYQSYRSWALSSSEYVRSTTDFYTALERAGFERRRTKTGILVFGLKPKAINQLLEAYGMPQVLLDAIEETFKTDALTQIIKSKTEELEDVNSSLERLITEQQVAKLPADEFSQQAAELEVRIQRLQLDLAESKSELTKTRAQKHALLKAIKNMSSATLESFEQSYWMAFIDKATVYPHQIVFTTRLGKDISIAI